MQGMTLIHNCSSTDLNSGLYMRRFVTRGYYHLNKSIRMIYCNIICICAIRLCFNLVGFFYVMISYLYTILYWYLYFLILICCIMRLYTFGQSFTEFHGALLIQINQRKCNHEKKNYTNAKNSFEIFCYMTLAHNNEN